MNEIIPTPESNDPPPVPPEHKLAPPNPLVPPSAEPIKQPLALGACIGLGVLLCIVSSLLCIVFPPMIVVGLAVAIGSLFFKGYRGIGLGYFLTIGVVLLGTIIYCAAYPLRID